MKMLLAPLADVCSACANTVRIVAGGEVEPDVIKNGSLNRMPNHPGTRKMYIKILYVLSAENILKVHTPL